MIPAARATLLSYSQQTVPSTSARLGFLCTSTKTGWAAREISLLQPQHAELKFPSHRQRYLAAWRNDFNVSLSLAAFLCLSVCRHSTRKIRVLASVIARRLSRPAHEFKNHSILALATARELFMGTQPDFMRRSVASVHGVVRSSDEHVFAGRIEHRWCWTLLDAWANRQ